MTSHPNVAVVVMDTTRARETVPARDGLTPALSSLAASGTEFSNVVSPAPWTLPAHASLFTGTYPSKHGAHGGHPALGGDLETLAETFGGAGYETVAVTNNTWISDEFGMTRGFETVEKTWQLDGAGADLGRMIQEKTLGGKLGVLRNRLFDGGRPVRNVLNALYLTIATDRASDDGAARTNDWIRAWLSDRDDDRPFFLFVNYLEPHIDYRPPRSHAEPFLPDGVSYEEAMAVRQQPRAYDVGEYDLTEREFDVLRGLYRGSIHYLDEQIGDLVDALAGAGEFDDTVFVVTSDHGENVGEFGLFGHQYNLYNTTLRVPLIATGGPFDGGHAASDGLVQHVDLPPTLLDAAGINGTGGHDGDNSYDGDGGHFDGEESVREQYQGHSLLAADAAGATGTDRTYAFSEYLAPQPSMDALERRFGELPESVRRFDRQLTAVQTAEYKLIRGSDGLRECYRIADDPHENEDIADADSETVGLLGKAIDDWRDSFEPATASGSVSMSADTEERLADLGYLQ